MVVTIVLTAVSTEVLAVIAGNLCIVIVIVAVSACSLRMLLLPPLELNTYYSS